MGRAPPAQRLTCGFTSRRSAYETPTGAHHCREAEASSERWAERDTGRGLVRGGSVQLHVDRSRRVNAAAPTAIKAAAINVTRR